MGSQAFSLRSWSSDQIGSVACERCQSIPVSSHGCKILGIDARTLGIWGMQGEEYLDQLSKRSKNEFGKPNRSEFKDKRRKRFAFQLCVHACAHTCEHACMCAIFSEYLV